MSSAQPSNEAATQASGAAAVPMRLEVTTLPVADNRDSEAGDR
jgi:hypothetical protein